MMEERERSLADRMHEVISLLRGISTEGFEPSDRNRRIDRAAPLLAELMSRVRDKMDLFILASLLLDVVARTFAAAEQAYEESRPAN